MADKPVERLFEFLADEAQWHVELHDNGVHGLDVVFVKGEEPVTWRHFDYRGQAVSWAEVERWLVRTERKTNCTYYERVFD